MKIKWKRKWKGCIRADFTIDGYPFRATIDQNTNPYGVEYCVVNKSNGDIVERYAKDTVPAARAACEDWIDKEGPQCVLEYRRRFHSSFTTQRLNNGYSDTFTIGANQR
jgi:hypothetical protein